MRLCASPFRLRHTTYVGLVVGSLGVGEVGVIVYVRAHKRVCTPTLVMFGLLWAVCQHPPWLDECALCSMMYLCLIIFAVDGGLNNVTPRSIILQALICKCTDCVPVYDRLDLAFIQLIALLSAPDWCQLLSCLHCKAQLRRSLL